jgi:hypothetical protein
MPMIDVYATAGTFTDQHQLAADLATAVMTIEQVPDIPMFGTQPGSGRRRHHPVRRRGRRSGHGDQGDHWHYEH